MNTSALIVQLLIIGIQVLAWVSLLILSISGYTWVSEIEIKDYLGLFVLVAIALSYTLGSVIYGLS